MHRNKRMALFVISVQKIGNIQIHSKQWFDLYHVSVIVALDVSTNSPQCKNANAVNHSTAGNPLFWENFLLPECLRDSIV